MVFFAFYCIWCFPVIFVYFWKIWHFYFNIFFSPKKAFNNRYFLPEVCQPYAWLQWLYQMNHGQSHLPECSSQVYLKITKIRHKKNKKRRIFTTDHKQSWPELTILLKLKVFLPSIAPDYAPPPPRPAMFFLVLWATNSHFFPPRFYVQRCAFRLDKRL